MPVFTIDGTLLLEPGVNLAEAQEPFSKLALYAAIDYLRRDIMKAISVSAQKGNTSQVAALKTLAHEVIGLSERLNVVAQEAIDRAGVLPWQPEVYDLDQGALGQIDSRLRELNSRFGNFTGIKREVGRTTGPAEAPGYLDKWTYFFKILAWTAAALAGSYVVYKVARRIPSKKSPTVRALPAPIKRKAA